ncbi:CBS domain-containing protein CBSX5 [Bienertia sinuspersici]
MAYVDYGGLPEDLVQLVKERLEEKKLDKMLELLEDFHSNSSISSSLAPERISGRFASGTEPIVCHPGSSLIAVMIQALSHRFNHVWVIEEDNSLVGIHFCRHVES